MVGLIHSDDQSRISEPSICKSYVRAQDGQQFFHIFAFYYKHELLYIYLQLIFGTVRRSRRESGMDNAFDLLLQYGRRRLVLHCYN